MHINKEVNYKLQRILKEKYTEEFLVLNTNNISYEWTDEYECADMFDSPEQLKEICNKFNLQIDTNKYYYYIVEDIVPDIIEYKEGDNYVK